VDTVEILKKDAFHASSEALIGVMQRLCDMSGCQGDTAKLVDDALSIGSGQPVIAINALRTEAERDEQKGRVQRRRLTIGGASRRGHIRPVAGTGITWTACRASGQRLGAGAAGAGVTRPHLRVGDRVA
jgi:hypothetical protein